MRWKIIALVTLVSLPGIQLVLAGERSIKATTPVEVSIHPTTNVKQGKRATFLVQASSSIPSDDFVIQILPVEGTEVIAGDLQWRGSVYPGEPRELQVTLRMANDSVPGVSVTSAIQKDGKVLFAASATYRQESENPGANRRASRERKVPRKGREVIEYRVR